LERRELQEGPPRIPLEAGAPSSRATLVIASSAGAPSSPPPARKPGRVRTSGGLTPPASANSREFIRVAVALCACDLLLKPCRQVRAMPLRRSCLFADYSGGSTVNGFECRHGQAQRPGALPTENDAAFGDIQSGCRRIARASSAPASSWRGGLLVTFARAQAKGRAARRRLLRLMPCAQ